MADINHVVLVGRLTRDAELKYTNSGSAISKFGLAINRRKRVDEQWVEEANFFDIVVWGKVAEALNPYLVKGKQVGVEGELRQNRWEQDGQKRSKVEISASNIQLLGSRGDSPQVATHESTVTNRPDDGYGGTKSDNSGDNFEDDIPF